MTGADVIFGAGGFALGVGGSFFRSEAA